jgi:SNF2 family DNA or RNA helicase
MGLGKTVQMIAVFLAEKEAGTEGTSLIVCPASLVYNWVEEMARFAPALRAAALGGGKSERTMMLENYRAYDVLVTSYDLLKRDILLYEGKNFLHQVLDEAQFVKTHSTAAAKSVRLVQALHRFALTGTPIENRLSELWSIFDFLMPGFLYPYETFRQKLETPIVKNQDEEAGRQLKRMVSPFVLRRLKGDVLKDLPDKLEEVRYVRFEGEQKRLYDAQVVRIRDFLEKRSDEDVNRSKIEILAELTRIRQICCDPSLLFEDYHAASAKREACLELIQSAVYEERTPGQVDHIAVEVKGIEALVADLRAKGVHFLAEEINVAPGLLDGVKNTFFTGPESVKPVDLERRQSPSTTRSNPCAVRMRIGRDMPLRSTPTMAAATAPVPHAPDSASTPRS